MAHNTKFRQGLDNKISFDHLRGRLDAELILEDLNIDIAFRVGREIMCHCPDLYGNHRNGDANPSFGFNEDKLSYNCFVCGGGDTLDLVSSVLNVSEEKALHFLEERSDFEPSSSEKLLAKVQKIMHPIEEKEIMPDYPLDNLFQYQKIHPYLYSRGLTKEVIIEMQVGYDDEHYGIVIPHIFQGKLVGWQIRHLAETIKGYVCPTCSQKKLKIPKYKNTDNFPKVNTLYNYDWAYRYCKENNVGDIIVVESPMTVLYLKSLGIENVVGTFGSFSSAQSSLLWPFETVLLWPDNDNAGSKNVSIAIDSLRRHCIVKIIPVVAGEKSDANDLMDRNEIDRYIQAAYSASLFTIYKLAAIEEIANIN